MTNQPGTMKNQPGTMKPTSRTQLEKVIIFRDKQTDRTFLLYIDMYTRNSTFDLTKSGYSYPNCMHGG